MREAMDPTISTNKPDFAALRVSIHRKLIQQVDLNRLKEVDQEVAQRELSQLIETLLVAESTPMTLQERKLLSQDVLDEVFGLGPLEPLLNDDSISDILVNTFENVYIERKGLLEKTSVQLMTGMTLGCLLLMVYQVSLECPCT